MKSSNYVIFLFSFVLLGIGLFTLRLDDKAISIALFMWSSLFVGIWLMGTLEKGWYINTSNLREDATFRLLMWDNTFTDSNHNPGLWTLMTIKVNKKEYQLLLVYTPDILCELKKGNDYFVRDGKIRSENRRPAKKENTSLELQPQETDIV